MTQLTCLPFDLHKTSNIGCIDSCETSRIYNPNCFAHLGPDISAHSSHSCSQFVRFFGFDPLQWQYA